VTIEYATVLAAIAIGRGVELERAARRRLAVRATYRARKRQLGQCRECSDVAVVKSGRTLQLCRTHLDADRARKAAI